MTADKKNTKETLNCLKDKENRKKELPKHGLGTF
jgi:hypothetical protein